MAHRSKHRRTNWTAERRTKSLDTASREARRPAPKPRQRPRPHRVLPVSAFLRMRMYR